MRRCPRRACRAPLAYSGSGWHCTSRFCTYETPATPGELDRLIRDVTMTARRTGRKGAR